MITPCRYFSKNTLYELTTDSTLLSVILLYHILCSNCTFCCRILVPPLTPSFYRINTLFYVFNFCPSIQISTLSHFLSLHSTHTFLNLSSILLCVCFLHSLCNKANFIEFLHLNDTEKIVYANFLVSEIIISLNQMN